MKQFLKHLLSCIMRLLLSELLCLVLAFSFALLRPSFLTNLLSLLFGLLAHVLLIGSSAVVIADQDASETRSDRQQHPIRTALLLSVILMLPSYITYLILHLHAESILWLNLFPLLNAPYLQIYRFLIAGTEPFSAVSPLSRMLMLLPALITGISFFTAYHYRFITRTAEANAIHSRK